MSVNIVENFRLGTNKPLDSRYVVNSVNDVSAYWFNGMLLYEKPNDKLFVVKDTSANTIVEIIDASNNKFENLLITEYDYDTQDTTVSTTSSTYVQVLRFTTASLPAGTYRISFGFNCYSGNSSIETQIQIDDTTTIYEGFESIATGTGPNWPYISGAIPVALTAGSHNIDLDFRRNYVNDTIYIKNVVIEIWRVL